MNAKEEEYHLTLTPRSQETTGQFTGKMDPIKKTKLIKTSSKQQVLWTQLAHFQLIHIHRYVNKLHKTPPCLKMTLMYY